MVVSIFCVVESQNDSLTDRFKISDNSTNQFLYPIVGENPWHLKYQEFGGHGWRVAHQRTRSDRSERSSLVIDDADWEVGSESQTHGTHGNDLPALLQMF